MKNSKDCISILIGFFHEKINDWTCLLRFQTVVEKNAWVAIYCKHFLRGVWREIFEFLRQKFVLWNFPETFCNHSLSIRSLEMIQISSWEEEVKRPFVNCEKTSAFFSCCQLRTRTCVTYFDREELKQLTRLQIFWTHVQIFFSFKFF